ncbi:MAG TPA: ATP-binding protein [Methylomirabilota bacterium]|jgi:signal transduction histidine kinase/ActR/RegA family two-component response regulator
MRHLHIAADAAIGVAYLAVAVALLHVARVRSELRGNATLVTGIVFSLSAATAHLADAWTLWQPTAWLAAAVRLLAATSAVITALLLLPRLTRALVMRTRGPRDRGGAQLASEVAARWAAEAKVRTLLESAPHERHGESERVDRLRAEVARAQAEEAGRRASFLAEASRVLAGSLDDEATLKSMARVAVPYLADYVLVDVLDAERRLRRLGAAHAEPAIEPALAEAPPFAFEPGADSPLAAVVERGEPTLVREVSEEWLAARPRDGAHLAAPSLRPTSLMLVPLRARGRALGLVCFALTQPGRRYSLADLAIAEDLAQRAALAADNARLYRDAQDASRAKDEFLAVLSHELRTPLTPVLGWVRMLRAGTLKPEAAGRALETVERNTRLQVQLVEDLLDVSRIITGKLRLEIRPVPLGDLVDAAIDAAAGAAAAKRLSVARSVAPDVPIIEADPNRLQQVLGNLLSNAMKFTPEGGKVDITVSATESHVRIAVADTGEGLLPGVAPHIFDRFRQADSTITRQYGGLGLGLAIVRHIVELHGGTVQAGSDGPGLGTTVTVLLPVAGPPGTPEERGRGSGAATPAAFGGTLKELRILVVDDDYDAREFLAAVLEAAGATVTLVSSAAEALESLARHPADVLLSDLAMPQRDGYDLMTEVRTRRLATGMVSIALSAQARPEDRERALAVGFEAHVSKPVDPDALAETIRRLTRPDRRRQKK